MMKKIVSWLFVFCVTVIPLTLVYNLFPEFRVWKMANSSEIFDSVVFYYDEFRGTAMSDSIEGVRRVYLPSHANLSEIRVEPINNRVEFISEDETITVYHDRENICAFEEDKEYEVIFYDRREETIASTKVCFLQSANLSTVYISTLSGNFEKIDADKKYSEEGTFSLLSENGQVLYGDIGLEISSRGNHTFNFMKKSYQFDLKQECNLLDMGESETWILLCNSYDLSNLRNKLTLDMAKYAGMEGVPQSEFVDVFLNNMYHGTYLLTEKVEFGENRLEYEDMESKNMLVNGTNLNTQKQFVSEDGDRKGYILSEMPQDITGGYLIEHDYSVKYDVETSGFRTDGGEEFVLKNPSHASKQEVDYIARLFQEIEDSIMSEDGYNPETGKHYSEYIDVKSWAQKYIIEEFSKNEGGGCTSSYFYKAPDNSSTKIFGGPVWDYDKAWGRQSGICSNTNDLNLLTIHDSYTKWFYYLYQHEEFRETVYEEYENVFAAYVEKEMQRQIDEYSYLLQASLEMNFFRFEQMYKHQIELEEVNLQVYEKEIEKLKEYICSRKKATDVLFGSEKELCTIYFKEYADDCRVSIIAKGDKIQTLPEIRIYDKEKYIWADEKTGEPIIQEMIIEKDMVAVVTEK